MTTEEGYKGYRLRIKRTSEFAIIIQPPIGLALETFAYATLEEGIDIARARAHKVIDDEIANS